MVDRLFADPDLAALYDALCPRDERGDFDFYLPMIMQADSVLDVGCGTGTLLHEARAAGHRGRLCGLDPAGGMLRIARARSDIEWVHGDLRTAELDGTFDFAVMTGHAFQVLVADDDIRAALTAIRRVLRVGGRFGFETRNPAARAWEEWTPEHAVDLVGPSGEHVRATTDVDVVDGERVTFTHTFTSAVWGGARTSRSTLRFLDRDSLDAFLSDAGLDVEERYGDWDRSPLTGASPEIVTVARAPSSRS